MGRVVVYHGGYGCDTGCCGHYVVLDEEEIERSWKFSHPYGQDHLEFARQMIIDTFGEDHCHDLDWENCIISED